MDNERDAMDRKVSLSCGIAPLGVCREMDQLKANNEVLSASLSQARAERDAAQVLLQLVTESRDDHALTVEGMTAEVQRLREETRQKSEQLFIYYVGLVLDAVATDFNAEAAPSALEEASIWWIQEFDYLMSITGPVETRGLGRFRVRGGE